MFKHLHSFVPFLRFFLFPMLFAVGADALGALGGGADAGVIDVPADGGEGGGQAAEGADEGAEGQRGEGEGGEPTEDGKEGQRRADGQRQATPELRRPLSRETKDALNGLKEANPKAWKELSQPMWRLNKVEKEAIETLGGENLEGAIQAATELKTQTDDFLQRAGYTDFAGVEAELQDFRLTDGKILKGDPSFINDLPENVQNGLFGMMPDFIGQWAKRDTEGYERYFLPVVLATMRDSGFEDQLRYSLRDLQRMGLDNADVKAIHDQLKPLSDWIDQAKNKIKTAPAKKPEPAAPDDATKEKLARADQIAAQQAEQRVGVKVNNAKGQTLRKAIHDHFGGKLPSYVNYGEVVIRARQELTDLLGDAVNERYRQYMRAGDEAGAAKYMISQLTSDRIAKAAGRAADYLYRKATLGTQKPGGGKPKGEGGGNGNPPKPTPGVTTIKYNPRAASIDLALSDKWAKELGISRNRLFTSNRAVLRGGKRVTWAQDAEPEE